MSFIKEKFIDHLNDDICFYWIFEAWESFLSIIIPFLQVKWAGNEHLKLEIIHVY